MCFRYINETFNRERAPTQVTPLASSIGSLFSRTYSMPPMPQSPGISPSRSESPALHMSIPDNYTRPPSHTLNSPPLRRAHSPLSSSADPHERSLSQPPQVTPMNYHTETTPYASTSRTRGNLSEFHGSNYQRPTSVSRADGFSSGRGSHFSASSAYSGSESRARPDGTPLHQSSRSYDSSYSFNPTASTSRYPGSYSQDPQYNNEGHGDHEH